MRKKCIAVLSAMAVMLVLAACGRQENQDASDGADAVLAVGVDTYWTGARWIHNGGTDSISTHPLYPAGEVRGLEAIPDEEYDGYSVQYCTLGNIAYGLEGFYRQTEDGWERSYYISRYDGTDEGAIHWPIELPGPEEYGAEEFIAAAFDVKQEQELVLFLQGLQDGQARKVCYLAVHMTPEGETLSVTDLYPAMLELDVDTDTAVTFEGAYVDGTGYYYLISRKADLSTGDDIHVLDADGKSVGVMSPGEGYAGAEWTMKLPDGNAVFSWSSRERGYILMGIYDREKNAVYTLLEERLLDSWLWTPAQDGYLYYVNSASELMRCDIHTGVVEDCMYYPQLGLEGGKRSARIIIGEDGEPEILGRRGGETVICKLGTETPDTDVIRLVSLTRYSNDLNLVDCVASFSQEHPDCLIQLEQLEGAYDEVSDEAYRDRAMAELVSGKGADMYYVWPSDMRMLQEKGVLADLSDLISEDTLSALWPGVLEMGTLDGQLVGIMPADWASTMIVSEELWPRDHWTLEEALDVMKAHPELQYPVMSAGTLDRTNVFSYLVMQNLADSPFLDLERGSCDFTNPLFSRALRLAGTYPERINFDEIQELYPKKNWVAMRISIDAIYYYDLYKTTLGEDYHVVGFPTEGENGTYWDDYMFLVVNRETKHAEQISAFLEDMLSYETQYDIRNPVRRDMLENRIEEFEIHIGFGAEIRTETITGYVFEKDSSGRFSYWRLDPGPKGDYRIGEYREVMEKCVGRSTDTSAIENIIWEEVGSYFAGDKEAEAVAAIIQNRVQLYLKERQ